MRSSRAALVLGPDDQHRSISDPGLPAYQAHRTSFGDGEQLIALADAGAIRDSDVLVVQTTSPPQSEHLVSLLQLIDAAAAAGAASVSAFVPYLCFQRQDRATAAGQATTARVVLRAIAAAGCQLVITADRHSQLTRGPGEPVVTELDCSGPIAAVVKASGSRPEVVVSPDAGAADRAARVAQALGLTTVVMTKLKSPQRGTYYEELPDGIEGRRCLIVEDLCSTGTTLVPLCTHLSGHAAAVDIAVTHILTSAGTVASRLPGARIIAYSDSCGDTDAPVRLLPLAVRHWSGLLQARPGGPAVPVPTLAGGAL